MALFSKNAKDALPCPFEPCEEVFPDKAELKTHIETAHQPTVVAGTPTFANADGSTTAVVGATAVVTGDPLDKKFDYFQYNESATYYEWERENPIQVPRDVLEAYPHLTFRYRAKDNRDGLRKGKEYHGWQVFRDKQRPNGIEFGGDLVLCAMPTEKAEAYRRWVSEQSTLQVKGIQDEQIENMERAAGSGDFIHVGQAGERLAGKDMGVTIGASTLKDKKTGHITEQYRGYHPEEIRERVAKAKEEAGKNRVYSIPK